MTTTPPRTRGGRRQSYQPAKGGRPRSPEIAERRSKALTMRNAGASYEKIGETLGITTQMAINDVSRAIKDAVRIPAGQMVDRQRAILLDLMRVEYPAAMNPDSPRHYQAQTKILAALDHEAKLFGLFAPAKVNVSAVSEREFALQAVELLKITGPGPLLELAKGSPDPRVAAEAEVIEHDESMGDWSNLE